MICNCEHNDTYQSELRIVRGNDFATLYTINAKYSDDTPVPNWDITRCTDISVKVHRTSYSNGVNNVKDISAYGSYRFANTNVLIIDWDGLLMKVGTYTVDFAAKFDGVDIRWYSKQTKAFDIVESNEEANIPEDTFIDDGIYRLDGDFVLMFGVQQQADWDQEDPTHPAYIKNRPEGIDTRDLLRKDEAELIYLAKADAYIPEHGELNQSTKEIDFYDENDNLLFSIDATAALKDASVTDITYSGGYLTFQFNSDAERPNIEFYIGDAFNSGSYYDKIASDLRYVTATTLLDYYTAQEVDAKIATVNSSISTINGKIPAAASSSNQLADKDFVNSSVSTATATFRGTSAVGLTESQFITWANSLTHDLNDYVYWNTTDTAGNTVYKRYKYNGTAWVYEYDLNNSSFTSSEWAAIQSGITSSLVSKLSALPTNTQLTNSLNNKQDTIGDLSDIRSGAQAGSTAYQLPNGGVPDTDIASASTWNGKQDTLVSGTNIKTINNQSLLGSGNIDISAATDAQVQNAVDEYLDTNMPTAGMFTNAAKQSLLALLRKVAYIDVNGQTYLTDLESKLFNKDVISISAVFTQGQNVIYDTDSIDSLKQYLVVTATWSDDTTSVVASSDYTLNGTLTVGTSIIVVLYGGETDTFTVTVTGYWDYSWDATSEALPTGMTAKSYDFTTESGALYVREPNLDFNYIGDGEIEIECKWSPPGPSQSFNNPSISLKREAKAGVKIYGASGSGYIATNLSGSNANTAYSDSDYHIINIKGVGTTYTLTIDGVSSTGNGVTNNNYLNHTGLASSTHSTNIYAMYIKYIRFKGDSA